jgi:hypothetical protein
MIVTVPKHSMTLYIFDGPDLNFPLLPLGFSKYRKIQAIKIINTSEFSYNIESFAANTINKNVIWKVINPGNVDFTLHTTSNGVDVFGSGTCNGNGTIFLKAMAEDDTTVFDQVSITFSGQMELGLDSCHVFVEPTVLGIAKSLNDKISVFPNPTEDYVYISSPKEPLATVKIYDVRGVLVYETKLKSNRQMHQIPLYTLKTGLYFLVIQSDNGEIAKRKIQKK